MNPTQSNTLAGRRPVTTGAVSLVGKEGFLCLLAVAGGALVVQLPAAIGDYASHIVDEGGAVGEPTQIDPLNPDRLYRIPCVDVIQPGAPIALAVGGDVGKGRALPGAAGSYRIVGRCEEAKPTVAGQFVLFRPSFEGIRVVV